MQKSYFLKPKSSCEPRKKVARVKCLSSPSNLSIELNFIEKVHIVLVERDKKNGCLDCKHTEGTRI